MNSVIKSICVSSSIHYVCLRYVTYVIQFLNSILLVRYLGEYKYGIYGFILILLQYLSYTNLGINESLNTDFALKKNQSYLPKLIWNNAWSINIILQVLVLLICLFITFYFPTLFEKYEYASYAILLLVTNTFINTNKLYVTFYKLYGKIGKINFQQILPNIILLVGILIYKENISIKFVLWSMLIGNAFPLVIFKINLPLQVHFMFHKKIVSRLLIRGVNLLLYNLSFYFILIAALSIVSIYYSVEIFGIYSFSNTLSNAVMMAGGAFLFIFYPKMVYKLGGKDKDKLQIFLEKIRNIYIFSIDLVALLSIIAIPIITCIVPITQSAINVFNILIIAKVVTNATSGYATLLVAKKQEMILTLYGIISISIVIVLGVLVGKYNYSVEFIAWSIVVASLSYAYLVLKRGMLFFKQISFGNIVKEMFNKGNSCALTCVTISIILNDNFFVQVMSIIIYIYLNRKQLSLTYRMILSILQDRNNLNF